MPTRAAPHVAAALALQRGAGNHAAATVLARDEKPPPGGSSEEIELGVNVSLELAKRAKAFAAKGALGDKELKKLRDEALQGDDTMTPDERVFLTALTDAGNAKVLAGARVADGVKLRFTFAKGATTRRVADLDRPVPEAATDDAAIERQLLGFAGKNRDLTTKAKAAMAFARKESVTTSLIRAAVAAASDPTPNDLLAAASAFAIGKAAGHPMADKLLAGQVKVDVRRIPGSAGRYNAIARPGSKGDTVSLASVPDAGSLEDRGTVIHELAHAAQDAGVEASPLRHLREPLDLEEDAYTVEAAYQLKQLAKLSEPKAHAAAAAQLLKRWGKARSGALAHAALNDPALLPAAQALSKVVRATDKKTADEFDKLLGGSKDAARKWLRQNVETHQISELDGLSGETPVDNSAVWSTRRPTVGRRVETTYGIRYARFRVGLELSQEMANTAWAATAAGPLDEAGLRKLRAVALSHWSSTINDDERQFMAALMDAGNARRLRAEHPSGLSGDAEVSFTADSITPANRRVVQDLGRRDVPKDRRDPAAPHVEGDTTELDRQIRAMAGAFAGVAGTALQIADKLSLPHVKLYYAMIAGASDSTPDDRAYAGIAYVLALEAGLDVASDIAAGRLKIDAVPSGYIALIDEDAGGAYYARGGTVKGDTVYLPWSNDPDRVNDRGTIVHELKHAATDKEQPKDLTRAKDELRSFEAEMRYVVGQIQPLTGAARTKAIAEAAKGAGKVEILAALGALRDDADPPDPDAVKVVEELNLAVSGGVRDVEPYLRMRIVALYEESLKAVAERYKKHKPSGRARTDGLRGESALD